MQIRNNSKSPITCPRLGIAEPVAPGEVIELDDKLCLRSKAHGFPNQPENSRPSILESVCPQLVPAEAKDREQYQTTRVEDLSEVQALNARNIAEQSNNGEAGAHLGQGRFQR